MTDPRAARRRATRGLAAATGLSAAALAVATPAAANHGKPNQWPDSRRQAVQEMSLERPGNVASDWGQLALSATDIIVSTGPDDIYVYDDEYGNSGNAGYGFTAPSYNGREVDPSPCAAMRCPRFVVQFNLSFSLTDTQWKKVGCHELGHTGGLEHFRSPHDATCMRTGLTAPLPLALDAHDKKTINANVAGV